MYSRFFHLFLDHDNYFDKMEMIQNTMINLKRIKPLFEDTYS